MFQLPLYNPIYSPTIFPLAEIGFRALWPGGTAGEFVRQEPLELVLGVYLGVFAVVIFALSKP